eukprot:5802853-Pyramimonas_sp.AAC.1
MVCAGALVIVKVMVTMCCRDRRRIPEGRPNSEAVCRRSKCVRCLCALKPCDCLVAMLIFAVANLKGKNRACTAHS